MIRALVIASIALAAPAAAEPAWTVDLQVDPAPFFLKGFAPELGVAMGGHRAYLTAVGYDVPSFLREDKRFAERRNVIASAGYEYFLRGRFAGPFVGGSVALTNATFSLADRDTMAVTTNTARIAVRLGWVFYPFSALPGLLFGPWISVGYGLAPRSFTIEDETIERRALGFAFAAQLGWRF